MFISVVRRFLNLELASGREPRLQPALQRPHPPVPAVHQHPGDTRRGCFVWSTAIHHDIAAGRHVDDGVGESSRTEHRDGVGLGNTRARLLSLYGSDHRFEAGSAPAGGFAVAIEIPYRTDAALRESGRRESEREALV